MRESWPNGRQSEIHNLETARHIDKRLADVSSAINGLKDGTKFGGIPQQVLMQPRETRNSAIAEGLREALVSRNPATTKHLT